MFFWIYRISLEDVGEAVLEREAISLAQALHTSQEFRL